MNVKIIKNPTHVPFGVLTGDAQDEWTDEYKLYVWDESDDGHRGIAFAIAKTEEEAKQLVIDKYESFDISIQSKEDIYWGNVTILPIKEYGNYSWG